MACHTRSSRVVGRRRGKCAVTVTVTDADADDAAVAVADD